MSTDVFERFYLCLNDHFNAFIKGIYLSLPDGVSSQRLKLDLVSHFKDMFQDVILYDPYHGLYRIPSNGTKSSKRKKGSIQGERVDFLTLLERIGELASDRKQRFLALIDGVDAYLNDEVVLVKLAEIMGWRSFGYSLTFIGFKEFPRYNPLSKLNIHEVPYPAPCRASLKEMVRAGLEAVRLKGEDSADLNELEGQTVDSLFGSPSLVVAEDILNLAFAKEGSFSPLLLEEIKLSKVVAQVPGLTIRSPAELPSLGQVAAFDNLKSYCEARRDIFLRRRGDHRNFQLRGICLLGPPGTGKTLFAQALANSWKVPHCSLSMTFMDHFFGASERNLDRMLRLLSDFDKPVLFHIDELSRLFGSHETDSHEVTRRVLAILLNFLESPESENVYTIGTMNHLQIDPALLRRFDDVFYVSLPDRQTRKALFEHFFNRYEISSSLDEAVIVYSRGMVGSEIERVVKDWQIEAWSKGVRPSPLELVRHLKSRQRVAALFAEISSMEEMAMKAGFRLASPCAETQAPTVSQDDQ